MRAAFGPAPLATFCCAVALSVPCAGQERIATDRVATLHLDDAWVPPGSRSVELYVRALTSGRAPVEDLAASDFVLREDEARIDADDVEVVPLDDAKLGVAVVLVLDTSPTMREPLAEMKGAARAFVDRVGDWDRVAVVTFAGRVEEAAPFTHDRAEVIQAIDAISAQQEPAPTRVYDAIYRAVEMLRAGQDLPRRGVVIVFSDGSDGGSEHPRAEVIELANRGGAGEGRVLIYTIAYPTGFGDQGLENLRAIAEGTTAEYRRVEGVLPITDFYGTVWRQLARSYVVRFPSDLDGASHVIELVAGDGSDQRTAYYPDAGGISGLWIATGLGAFVVFIGGIWLIYTRRPGHLVHQSGPDRGAAVKLQRGRNRIGQLPDNEIVVTHDAVSRRHASIEVAGGRARIADLESTNGTFVNDVPVESGRDLAVGDRVRIADVEFVYKR